MNQRRSFNRRTTRVPTRQIIYPMIPASNTYNPDHDEMGRPINLSIVAEAETVNTIYTEDDQPISISINQSHVTPLHEVPLLRRVVDSIMEWFGDESTTVNVYDSSVINTGPNTETYEDEPRNESLPGREFSEGSVSQETDPTSENEEVNGQAEDKSANILKERSVLRETENQVSAAENLLVSPKRSNEPRIDSLRSKMWMNLKIYSIDDIKRGLEYIKEERRKAVRISKNKVKIVQKRTYSEDSYLDIIGTNVLWER